MCEEHMMEDAQSLGGETNEKLAVDFRSIYSVAIQCLAVSRDNSGCDIREEETILRLAVAVGEAAGRAGGGGHRPAW